MNGALHPDLAEALRRGEAFSAAVCNGGMPIGRGCGTGSVPLSGCSGACAPPTHPLCTHSAPDLVGIPWMGTGLPPGAGVKGQVGPHGMHACPLSLHAPNSLALPFLPPPPPCTTQACPALGSLALSAACQVGGAVPPSPLPMHRSHPPAPMHSLPCSSRVHPAERAANPAAAPAAAAPAAHGVQAALAAPGHPGSTSAQRAAPPVYVLPCSGLAPTHCHCRHARRCAGRPSL